MKQLYQLIQQLEGKRIAVIGDVMLDEHMWCNVTRISPEAPVPVARVERITHVPGGAANVARNIVDISGYAYLIGVVGDDTSAITLKEVLNRNKVNTDYLISDPSRPTITKSRIIAHNQQVVRVDQEDDSQLSQESQDRIYSLVRDHIHEFDGLILSDYNKGVLTDKLIVKLIKLARDNHKIISIDPKGDDYSKYKNASLITPNKKEASEAIGKQLISHEQIIEEGRKLRDRLKLDNLLITRSEEGMSLFTNSGDEHIPTVAREVFDVSGAGDTVIAVMSLALAAGFEPLKAAELANLAAGIVVAKIGTASLTLQELKEAIVNKRKMERPWIRKILNSDNIENRLDLERAKKKKIVSTNGVFDILHIGHTRYLTEAKQCGDILVIAVNDDASVKMIKGDTRPINPLEDRLEMLANLEVVDFVIPFSEKTPVEILKRIKPDIHVKGGDYDVESLPETPVVRGNGGDVRVLSLIAGKSSTSVIEAMKGESGCCNTQKGSKSGIDNTQKGSI